LKAHLDVQNIWTTRLTREEIESLYPHVMDSDVFEAMVTYLTSEPVFIIIVCGENAVQGVLDIKGKCNTKGLRRKYAPDSLHNVMHSSQNAEEAEIEIGIWRQPHGV